MRILVTGATGFIGRHLCQALVEQCSVVYATVTSLEKTSLLPGGVTPIIVGDTFLGKTISWFPDDVETVIHLAARVHIMKERSSDPLKQFRLMNTIATESLAMTAAAAGVKHFILLSTIGVNGPQSFVPFKEADDPFPSNPYSISKHEAEKKLLDICHVTNMDFTIIRAPLVYGPRNPGNFLKLLQLVNRRIPLPLGSVKNIRSYLFVGNLTDAIISCVKNLNARNELYLVSDSETISTADLIRKIAGLMNRPSLVFSFPMPLLIWLVSCFGLRSRFEKVTGSLIVDKSKITSQLNWQPPFSLEHGLAVTTKWFLENKN